MSLSTSKTVLKILGILTIIGAVLTLIFGIIALTAGGAGLSDTAPDLQETGALLIGAGVMVLVSGIVSLLQGIFSVLASNNSKYGTVAWIFALLGVVSAALTLVSKIFGGGNGFSDLLSTICSVVISGVLVVAADNVKKAYKEGTEA